MTNAPRVKSLPPAAYGNKLDRICYEIVRELDKRSYQVEGIEVEFGYSERGNYIFVHTIKRKDFTIVFERGMGDILAVDIGVSRVLVPECVLLTPRSFEIFIFTYKGDNWEADVKDPIKTPFLTATAKEWPNTVWNYSHLAYFRDRGNANQKLDYICNWLDRYVLDYILCQLVGEASS